MKRKTYPVLALLLAAVLTSACRIIEIIITPK
jgi:predicted small secreted protein